MDGLKYCKDCKHRIKSGACKVLSVGVVITYVPRKAQICEKFNNKH